MSTLTIGLLLFVAMLLLMAIRVPIAVAMFVPGALKSGATQKSNKVPRPLAASTRMYSATCSLFESLEIASSSALIGVWPAALIRATSMPVAYRSPISLSTPFADLFTAACSASCCWVCLERSSSMSKEPQLVRSDGTGWAARNLALA